jgi:hypothetical protein
VTKEDFAARRAEAMRLSRDGRSLREIAEQLGVSKDTVFRDLKRAEREASRDEADMSRDSEATVEPLPRDTRDRVRQSGGADETPPPVSRDDHASAAEPSRQGGDTVRQTDATGETAPGAARATRPDLRSPVASPASDDMPGPGEVWRDSALPGSPAVERRTLTVTHDNDQRDDFAALSQTGATDEEIAAFAVSCLASAYRNARLAGLLPAGPFDVTAMTLRATGPARAVPRPGWWRRLWSASTRPFGRQRAWRVAVPLPAAAW